METYEILNQQAALAQSKTEETLVLIIGFTMILTWLVLCVVQMRKFIQKFTYMGDQNPYKNDTLGLPTGTFRGMLTITLMIVVVVLVCMSMAVERFRGNFESLVGAFEVMLAFYFGSKVMSNITESDRDKAQKKADAEKAKAAAMASQGTVTQVVKSDFDVTSAVG